VVNSEIKILPLIVSLVASPSAPARERFSHFGFKTFSQSSLTSAFLRSSLFLVIWKTFRSMSNAFQFLNVQCAGACIWHINLGLFCHFYLVVKGGLCTSFNGTGLRGAKRINRNTKPNDSNKPIPTSGAFSLQSFSVYEASKAAINAVMKIAALELASRKIRVNVVSPGPIAAETMNKIVVYDSQEAQVLNSVPSQDSVNLTKSPI